MVFIALGTHGKPMDRVVEWAVKISDLGLLPGPVVVQSAVPSVHLSVTWLPIIPKEEFLGYMDRSDLLVTHGGLGTIMGALGLGRIPIVVPREHRYGEHVDDHQVLFATVLTDLGLPVVRTWSDFLAQAAIKRTRSSSLEILKEVSRGLVPLSALISGMRDSVEGGRPSADKSSHY